MLEWIEGEWYLAVHCQLCGVQFPFARAEDRFRGCPIKLLVSTASRRTSRSKLSGTVSVSVSQSPPTNVDGRHVRVQRIDGMGTSRAMSASAGVISQALARVIKLSCRTVAPQTSNAAELTSYGPAVVD